MPPRSIAGTCQWIADTGVRLSPIDKYWACLHHELSSDIVLLDCRLLNSDRCVTDGVVKLGGPLKILIADDQAIVRQGLKDILREMAVPSVVREAMNGNEAMALGVAEEWDVIILDITMPGQSGLDVLKILKRERSAVPVLMLSVHTEPHYVQHSLGAGASGYLSKESAPEELVIAIESVLLGEIYLSHDLA